MRVTRIFEDLTKTGVVHDGERMNSNLARPHWKKPLAAFSFNISQERL